MMLLFGALFMALLLETKTCRSLLIHYGEHLGLDSKKIPDKSSVSQFAEAMVKAWTEYNNSRKNTILQLFRKHWQKLMCKGNYFLMELFLLVANQFHLSILELVMHQLIILQNQNGEPGYVWSSLLL
ncbi:uncharacterized protein LOC123221850 isoform X3 [Mangifera indica]|uniref:uncharacterized protein LOC123221850 isoform X3 n=1 Tax=Mangifera indica TaxID=29780 RepID=UPI001CF9A607|nr:uncharacterized protein LOC123221850 isoform X3 [Mangifera indica]